MDPPTTPSQPHSPPTPSRLLTLPAEIRLIIYTHLFTTPQTIVPKPDVAYRPLEITYSGPRLDGILTANHQLHAETQHLFYAQTNFVFESRYITIPRAMETFVRKIGQVNTGLIERVFVVREGDAGFSSSSNKRNGVTGMMRVCEGMKWAREFFPGLKILRIVFTKVMSRERIVGSRKNIELWRCFQEVVREQQPGLREFLEKKVSVRMEVRGFHDDGGEIGPGATVKNSGWWISGRLGPEGRRGLCFRLLGEEMGAWRGGGGEEEEDLIPPCSPGGSDDEKLDDGKLGEEESKGEESEEEESEEEESDEKESDEEESDDEESDDEDSVKKVSDDEDSDAEDSEDGDSDDEDSD
ncbi:MAG: hypothetical protein Q9186_001273 [Xanthomendoza sp. 1 TL-2023]